LPIHEEIAAPVHLIWQLGSRPEDCAPNILQLVLKKLRALKIRLSTNLESLLAKTTPTLVNEEKSGWFESTTTGWFSTDRRLKEA
jgi:hypothetical protein